jgi:hypothetical protein
MPTGLSTEVTPARGVALTRKKLLKVELILDSVDVAYSLPVPEMIARRY